MWFAVLLTLTALAGQITVSPLSKQFREKLNEFREPLPTVQVRKLFVKDKDTRVITTKENFYTVIRVGLGNFTFFVGNPTAYEVRRNGEFLLVRPTKRFVNSNLVLITPDKKTVQLLLTQSLDECDTYVEVLWKKSPNYKEELVKAINGKSKVLRLERFKGGKEAIVVGNKVYGVENAGED